MTNWHEKFLDADSGTCDTSQRDTINEPTTHDVGYLLEIHASNALRLYDSTREKGTLDKKLKKDFRKEVNGLNRQEKLGVYIYLRDNAMLYKMAGDTYQWDRHLEAADYLRREFKLKL